MKLKKADQYKAPGMVKKKTHKLRIRQAKKIQELVEPERTRGKESLTKARG
jgi:hypothetical protein